MRFIPLLIFLLLSSISFAQEKIEGQLFDSQSKRPIAFVNIVVEKSGKGVSSDIDGRFQLQVNATDKLIFSSISYKRDTLSVEKVKAFKGIVFLNPSSYQLKAVNIKAGENPAHRIIRAAIANKDKNNPEKATAFHYESYNKLVVTGQPDSAFLALSDSMQKAKDSIAYEGIQELKKSAIFMMESVTERNHVPPTNSKEVVLASRVSGLKNPMFSLIGTQLQSFSLYSNYIQLLGKAFLSPLSGGSTNKYLFIIEDTLYSGKDTIFSISYRPRKGKFFDGLQGVLNINTDGYAVQNFSATTIDEPMASIGILIHQKYKKIEEKQWFPVQLNTKLIFYDLSGPHIKMVAEGKSYLKNIVLNSELSKKEIGNVVLQMDEEAGKKDSSYWKKHREIPLSTKEKETYRLVDSLGKAMHLDRKFQLYQVLFKGAFPLGPFDILLKDLVRYNGYEGFRLGLGAETNDHISKFFRVGGYGAYGFKDKKWKYGGHLKIDPLWETTTTAKFSYAKDLTESGGIHLFNDWVNPLSTEDFQKLLIQQMDGVERYDIQVESHLLRDFQFTFFGNVQNRSINSSYRFEKEETSKYFRLVESGVGVRFAFREKYVKMFDVKMPIGFEYPVVHLKYSHGFNSILDGEYAYNRIDLKLQKLLRIRNLGLTSFQLKAGYIDRPLPMTALFRSRGSYFPDLPIATDYSFQTIRPDEFFHDQYLAFFFKHSFKTLLFNSTFFKPELALVTNVGWGKMSHKGLHLQQDFQTMDKGFYESGVQIDRLIGFMNLGIGVYYRYGAYHLPKLEDNFFYKLTYTFKM